MAVKITYFVHGTTVDNENHISSGWSDTVLSEKGVSQSKELRERVKGAHYDAVFCSDLKRAVDSARIAFEGLAPIIIDHRLRECNYGVFNGKSSDIVEPMQEKHLIARFPDGESYIDVKERMESFLDFLKTEYDGKHIAIVAHKAPQLALDVLVRNRTWDQAFAEDWRKTGAWKPGWDYVLE
jgi:broad specificity phosphatase PhoE